MLVLSSFYKVHTTHIRVVNARRCHHRILTEDTPYAKEAVLAGRRQTGFSEPPSFFSILRILGSSLLATAPPFSPPWL